MRVPDEAGEVGESAGVAPLVVVPAEDLDEPAGGLGQGRVEDARGAVADDVGGDERLVLVAQPTRQRAARPQRQRRPR